MRGPVGFANGDVCTHLQNHAGFLLLTKFYSKLLITEQDMNNKRKIGYSKHGCPGEGGGGTLKAKMKKIPATFFPNYMQNHDQSDLYCPGEAAHQVLGRSEDFQNFDACSASYLCKA